MSTLLASAASNRLEALARRLFAGLLVFSFLEAISNQFAQREYFNMASDVALAAMAIAVVGVAVSGGSAVAVEVNSETDFVGKNAEFQEMVAVITNAALNVSDIEALKSANMDGKTVSDVVTDKIATIGENMSVRRMAKVEGEVVGSYVHTAAAEGMGKIGVLVALNGGRVSR